MGKAARFWHWWKPKTAVPFSPPVSHLGLVDFDSTGLTLAFLALIRSGDSGDDRYQPSNNIGSLLEGSLAIEARVINRIRFQNGGNTCTLNGSGGSAFNVLFGAGTPRPDPVIHIQTEAGVAMAPLDQAGGGFIRFRPSDDEDILDDVADDERFIIAVSYTP